jgi:hypothetical protein
MIDAGLRGNGDSGRAEDQATYWPAQYPASGFSINAA